MDAESEGDSSSSSESEAAAPLGFLWSAQNLPRPSSTSSDAGEFRPRGHVALQRAFKERKAMEDMEREALILQLMQVVTLFWKRRKDPEWAKPPKELLRKHLTEICSTSRAARRLGNTAEALVLLCAETHTAKGKAQVDKKEIWADYKSRTLMQLHPRGVVKLPKLKDDPTRELRGSNRLARLVLDTGQLSARGQYLQVCTQQGIPPVVETLTSGQSSLNMVDQNLSDHDMLALLPLLETGTLNSVDFSCNPRLTDRGLVPLLRALPATLRRLALRSSALGPNGTALLAELLVSRVGFSKLLLLDLSEVPLQRKGFQLLAQSIAAHRNLQELNLCSTGLSPYASDARRWLMQCPQLLKLDLSWNSLDAPALLQLGHCLSTRRALQKLSLAGCGAHRVRRDAELPMEGFLELLAKNSTLKELDLSLNHMDHRAALILEDALEHTELRALTLNDNPLGPAGLRSVLRLLCGKAGIHFLKLSGCHSGSPDGDIFNFVNPGGRYHLDLGRPYDRSLLRMLHKKCEDAGQPPSAAFHDVSHSFCAEKTDGIYQVPQSGHVSLSFCEPQPEVSEPWSFQRVLDRTWCERRVSPSCYQMAQLLRQWHLAEEDPETKLILLEVLAKDFIVSSALLKEMCASQPNMLREILSRLIHCIRGRAQQYLATMLAPSVCSFLRVMDNVKKLLSFTAENPTGHYFLELSEASDFALAEQILALNRWETRVEQHLNYPDTSPLGNRCHLRNMTYAGRRLPVQDVREWILPMSEVFAFDYVSSKRPLPSDPALEPEDFQKFLKALARGRLGPELRLRALRAVACHLFLQAAQLRLILGLFEEGFRARCAVIFFFRVVDMQNQKIFRCALEDQQLKLLQKSLGCLACFPFIQLEHYTAELDMSFQDQRRAVQILWQLAEKERSQNLQDVVYKSADGHVLPGDQPRPWFVWESVPTSGHVKVTYTGGKETCCLPLRKKLHEEFGHWRFEGEVNWWSSLAEAPAEVIRFLQLCLRKFQDLDQAFTFIDGVNGNGVIGLKEMADRVKRIGKLPGSAVQKVFRFLDPDSSGSISRKEWSALGDLQKEVRMQLEEFTLFAQREFSPARGALQRIWAMIDAENQGQVTRKEFQEAVRRLGFFGRGVIAEFLDIDGKGFVSLEDMQQLRRFQRDQRSQSLRTKKSRLLLPRRKSAL
ncbi:unnamed protein product [Effrenium voratum]|nr:unnamed protein product [Effrenium voratum]